MVVTLVLLGFVMATSLAGEVAQTGYSVKPDYDYHTSVEFGQTPRGHKFYLKIYSQRRYDSNRSRLRPRITLEDLVQVYYDKYLLDNVKVPWIDKLKDHLGTVDSTIIDSFIPEMPVPEQDVAAPDKITVYYHFTDGDCVKAVYTHSSDLHIVYGKRDSDEVVDQAKCTRGT